MFRSEAGRALHAAIDEGDEDKALSVLAREPKAAWLRDHDSVGAGGGGPGSRHTTSYGPYPVHRAVGFLQLHMRP